MTWIMRQVTEKPSDSVNTVGGTYSAQFLHVTSKMQTFLWDGWFILSTFGFYSLDVSGLLLIQKVSKQNLYRLNFSFIPAFYRRCDLLTFSIMKWIKLTVRCSTCTHDYMIWVSEDAKKSKTSHRLFVKSKQSGTLQSNEHHLVWEIKSSFTKCLDEQMETLSWAERSWQLFTGKYLAF